ncbi:MAG: hypothetical protein U5L08_15925 [Xanthomonadales bacterium]|nr:hypothetical protein [Xanthomonadales bacterium]
MDKYNLRIGTILRVAAVALAGLLLAGCSTYSGTRDDGVYYQTPKYRGGAVHVDPTLYPYWSLDYFYYSHYYHPYSVLVHRYDPWYYPYPGWYYGYRPGPHHIGQFGHFRYPWYRLGNRYAGGYRSWHYGHWSDDPRAHERFDNSNRVRQIDARLRELETRRSLSIRSQRPDRHLTPRTAPWMPATGRGTAIRRNDPRRPPPVHPGTRAADTGGETGRRQALIERLRAADRSTGLPPDRNRSSDRRPASPPPSDRDVLPRQRTFEPNAPIRQRPVDPSPPRSSPQRSTQREPARAPTRSRPPQSRPRSDRRERRERH